MSDETSEVTLYKIARRRFAERMLMVPKWVNDEEWNRADHIQRIEDDLDALIGAMANLPLSFLQEMRS